MRTWWQRFGRREDLVAYGVAVGAAVLEVAGLRAVGMVSTLPLAAQASGVPVVGTSHDVRWVLVYASSWPVLGGEVVAAVAYRAALSAVMIRARWPDRSNVPAWGALLERNAVASFVLLAAMSPWGVLSFVTGVSSISYPLIGGLFGALLVGVLVLPHAGIAPRWWARWAPWRAMTWTLLDFGVVTVTAVGIAYSPGWLVLVTAAAGGLLNGWCWDHLVRACATAPAPARSARRALAGVVAVPVSLFVVVTGLPIAASSGVAAYAGSTSSSTGALAAARARVLARTAGSPVATAPRGTGARAVLMVNGFESHWTGVRPVESFPGFTTVQYSYAGLGPHGAPLPYTSRDTVQSLVTSADRMAEEVAALAAVTGRPVDIVAVSEGTYVVDQYLATHRRPPVHTVVLSSPLPRPDRVHYPDLRRSSGFGLAAGWEAHVLMDVAKDERPTEDIQTDMPMIRSLQGEGPRFRQRSLCPVPGVRVVALLPLLAAVDVPPGPVAGIPTGVVPAIHGTVASTGSVRRELLSVLRGQPLSRYFGWGLAFQITRYAASAWEVPSLPLSAPAVWRERGGDRLGDAAFGSYGCRALDHPSVRIHGLAAGERHR